MGKRIFMVGDFESNTGPAIANKALKKALGRRVRCSRGKKTHIGRVLELIAGILRSDVICFCGFSELNVYGIKLAKTFRKKTAYLMHGYIELETKINHCEVKPRRIEAEHYILRNADMVICVSKLLASEVMKKYPELKNVRVVYNVVEPVCDVGDPTKKDPLLIMSTGGGMPRKNNLVVCEAIEKINSKLPVNKRLRYIVTGKPCCYEEKFTKYDFVDFMGEVSHGECLELMKRSKLYIQNSLFETFGLAIIEAIRCGCEVIASRCIGSIEVIDNLPSMCVLNNPNDIEEVMAKINSVVKNKNASELIVRETMISRKSVANRLLRFLEETTDD